VGVKFTFESEYRGGTKEWSQLYHFTGPAWTLTTFNDFTDALLPDLRNCLDNAHTVTGRIAYDAGSSVPVFDEGLSLAGTSTATGGIRAALEACGLARFTTDQRTTKNHPIYLYKWFHGVWAADNPRPELLSGTLRTQIGTFAALIVAGVSDGVQVRQYCSPRGAVAQDHLIEEYLHMREFPT
jgi:hypothetical protein